MMSSLFKFHTQLDHSKLNHEALKKIDEMYTEFINNDKEIQSFTMKQLNRPVRFVLYLYGIAMIIFLAECIVYYWKAWRDRK